MFSGIVEQMGVVAAVEPCDFGQTLVIDPCGWTHNPAAGESIAVNGCCLTVTASGPNAAAGSAASRGGRLRFDVIRQTLVMTTLGTLAPGDPVNLEHAVTPSTMLGGHIVQGHIDGVAVVRHVKRDETERRLRIEPPAELLEFIVEKGSIAVDGVSMTVAALGEPWFEIALIPTTIAITTLGRLREGAQVNLETDCIVRAVVHWLRQQRAAQE